MVQVKNSDWDHVVQRIWRNGLSKAREGQASYVCLIDPGQVCTSAVLEKINKEIVDEDARSRIITLDLAGRFPGPWSPFLDCISMLLSRLSAEKRRSIIDKSVLFKRQMALFETLLPGQDPRTTQSPEPATQEEFHFESLAIIHTLKKLLRTVVKEQGRPVVLVCRGSENLPAETIQFLRQLGSIRDLPLLLVLIFTLVPSLHGSDTPSETFLREQISQAKASIIDHDGGPTLPPLVPQASLSEVQLLYEWQCHFTAQGALDVLRLVQDPTVRCPTPVAEQRRRELLLQLCLVKEALEDYNQAVFYGELLLGVLDPGRDAGLFTQCICALARSYRAKGDHDTLFRYMSKARVVGDQLSSRTDKALMDFHALILMQGPDSPIRNDVALLAYHTKELQNLGWVNHLANIQTRNVRIMSLFWRDGYQVALDTLNSGLLTAKAQGNFRRLSVGIHTQGTLLQAQGLERLALDAYTKAHRLMEHWAPLEGLARVQNAMGFYYLSLGLHRDAYDYHMRALACLAGSTYYEQIAATIINLATVYLYADDFGTSISLMESVLLVMDKLGMTDLPFHPRTRIYYVMGVSFIKAGELSRAEEINRLMTTLAQEGHELNLSIMPLYFDGLLKLSRNDLVGAIQAFEIVRSDCELALGENRHFLILTLLDHAKALCGYRPGTAEPLPCPHDYQVQGLVARVLELCLPYPWHQYERQGANYLVGLGPKPTLPVLPPATFDPQRVLKQVEQQENLAKLQQTIRDNQFIQVWQDSLVQTQNPTQCIFSARNLLRQTFLLDEVGIHARGDKGFQWIIENLGDAPFYTAEIGYAGMYKSVSSVPVVVGGELQFFIILASTKDYNMVSLDDHRVILLAGQYLSAILLAQGRQQALEKSNDELSRTLETLKEAQNQLVQSEKLASLGSLVAGVAHEINTPIGICLSAITFFQSEAQVVQQRFKGAQLKRAELEGFFDTTREASSIILSNLTRAVELIKSFKLVGADRSSEHRRAFDVRDYIGEIMTSLGPKIREHRVTYSISGELGLILDGYPGAFSQVLTNLVVNSLIHAFAPEVQGSLSIEVAKSAQDRIRVSIADDGRGIPVDIQDKIFDPFYTTLRGRGGTGLGLHICHNLVTEILGGTLVCESIPGKGSRFTMDLPLVSPVLY